MFYVSKDLPSLIGFNLAMPLVTQYLCSFGTGPSGAKAGCRAVKRLRGQTEFGFGLVGLVPQFRDAAMAGPATLNRLELSSHK
jgi:hypothetical protein